MPLTIDTKTQDRIDSFLARKRERFPDLFKDSVDDNIHDLDSFIPRYDAIA